MTPAGFIVPTWAGRLWSAGPLLELRMKILKTISERKCHEGNYTRKVELIDDSEYGGDGKLVMKNAYRWLQRSKISVY